MRLGSDRKPAHSRISQSVSLEPNLAGKMTSTLSSIIKIHHPLRPDLPFSIVLRESVEPIRDWIFDSHYALHICIVSSGRLDVAYPKHVRSVGPGQFWLTSCWEPHAIKSTGEFHYVLITFFMEYLGLASPFHDVHWLAPFLLTPELRPQSQSEEDIATVLDAGKLIHRLETGKPYGWQTLQWMKIHELATSISAMMKTQAGVDGSHSALNQLMPILSWIQESPEKKLSLEQAASICKLGRSKFSTVFTRVMGVSFSKFALRVRISHAAQALRYPDASTKEIAARFGFKDTSHFYHVFTSHFHCTPHEYVKRYTDSNQSVGLWGLDGFS